MQQDIIVAARDGNLQAVTDQLNAGANPDGTIGDTAYTPLYLATSNSHLAIMETLLNAGATTNIATNGGMWTPLHIAAYNGDVAAVSLLLRRNATASCANLPGNTPLDIAIDEGHAAIVDLLTAPAQSKG